MVAVPVRPDRLCPALQEGSFKFGEGKGDCHVTAWRLDAGAGFGFAGAGACDTWASGRTTRDIRSIAAFASAGVMGSGGAMLITFFARGLSRCMTSGTLSAHGHARAKDIR